jgi:hypothetical protein
MSPLIICPECGENNQPNAAECQHCGLVLPVIDSSEEPESLSLKNEGFNPLPQADNDLPELFHSVKHDETLDSEDEPISDEVDSTTLDISESMPEGDLNEGTEEPDWLKRIRQRAKEEADSMGDITQRISAAQESLAEEISNQQRQEFDSIIQGIRDNPDDAPVVENSGEQNTDSSEPLSGDELDWLSKVRKARGLDPEADLLKTGDKADQAGDSLLQWLVELEEDQPTGDIKDEVLPDRSPQGDEESDQITPTQPPGQVDRTQEIILTSESALHLKKPKLNISRDEQHQADQLASTVLDERTPRPGKSKVRTAPMWVLRLLTSVLLIAVVGLSLFTGRDLLLRPGINPSHSTALLSWAEGLSEGDSLLLVFDYQAGLSGEIQINARPVMELITQQKPQITIVSSSVAGPILYQELFDSVSDIELRDIDDLGYFPLASFGAYVLANQATPGWQFIGTPETHHALQLENFDSMLIFSDTYESAGVWIEQVHTLSPEIEIYLVLAAQAAPLLTPYYDSGQVSGLIYGFEDFEGIGTHQGKTSTGPNRWQAYQAGVIVLIAFLVFGVVFSRPNLTVGENEGNN